MNFYDSAPELETIIPAGSKYMVDRSDKIIEAVKDIAGVKETLWEEFDGTNVTGEYLMLDGTKILVVYLCLKHRVM
jgi:hypothetical protein